MVVNAGVSVRLTFVVERTRRLTLAAIAVQKRKPGTPTGAVPPALGLHGQAVAGDLRSGGIAKGAKAAVMISGTLLEQGY